MPNDSDNNRFVQDLRNSLSAIYSYAQMLELMLDSPTTQKELDITESICESAKKMNTLIKAHEDAFRSHGEVEAPVARLAETEGSSC